MAKSKEELKRLLMKGKEESEKAGLKLKTQHSKKEDHDIQFHHFMVNRWGSHGNSDRIFSWAKITAVGDYSHEIKRHLLLGRKAMLPYT